MCLVIQDILANHFIHLIDPQEVIVGFCHMGFPNCMGAVDGIIGDPAYALRPWLMKPSGGQLDRWKENFNYCRSRCHMMVECAFGHLKVHWRTVSVCLKVDKENMTQLIIVTCVLHNICEAWGGYRFTDS
ncbi:hypothetical protein Y1Q_0003079 [Alligator mississippiensis]|uniref:DDE Tnp4 domain-containing protein n=1 Tax=Alligator mississippiensis TaxID=8496 RepID=A0A151MDF9_ALLMI|nr:hypothetical protein Y1Q_0003079 [Alligator mississippiensis]